MAEYRLSKRFGLGAGLNVLGLNLDVDGDDRLAKLDNTLTGVVVYGAIYFGGSAERISHFDLRSAVKRTGRIRFCACSPATDLSSQKTRVTAATPFEASTIEVHVETVASGHQAWGTTARSVVGDLGGLDRVGIRRPRSSRLAPPRRGGCRVYPPPRSRRSSPSRVAGTRRTAR